MVISPSAALRGPPETGASMKCRPAASSFASHCGGKAGSTVAEATTTLPARRLDASPASPNSTASVCCALTTSTTTTLQRAASEAMSTAGRPPAAAKRSRASARGSKPQVSKPRRWADTAAP